MPHTIRIDEQSQPGHPAVLENPSPTQSAGRDDSISLAPLESLIDNIQAAADDANHRFLTPSEAAEFLGGLHSRTVNRWAREGYLPSYPIGEGKRGLWRFLESDLAQWMFSRRTGQINSDSMHAGNILIAAIDALFRDHPMTESRRFQNGSSARMKNKSAADTWFLRIHEHIGESRVYGNCKIGPAKGYPHRRDATNPIKSSAFSTSLHPRVASCGH